MGYPFKPRNRRNVGLKNLTGCDVLQILSVGQAAAVDRTMPPWTGDQVRS
jgi:hypothetical protein